MAGPSSSAALFGFRFRDSGADGEAGVTLLELIIAISVLLIVSAGISAPGARAGQRTLHTACLRLQADIREAQHRAVLEGADYIVSFMPADNYYALKL
ncbi:MAG: prepilin-type N-terminal cleavage/methylation domain-containing protein, partial [Clostridiales bacterium]|nr:prepilin-type N-terminal cleavage/methylation domain-containing protein [Clostridiales bacterium]